MAVEPRKQESATSNNHKSLVNHYESKEDAIKDLNSLYSRLESCLKFDQEEDASMRKLSSEDEIYDISFSGNKPVDVVSEFFNQPRNYELGVLNVEGTVEEDSYKLEAYLDFDKRAGDLLELTIQETVRDHLEQ